VAIPTLFEAVSAPISEAWLEGTPIACSDIPQLREQAEGAALFFDPLSPESIAAALERLLNEDELRETLSISHSSVRGDPPTGG
jgi:glycosyltransferase involved in cell wall biosynthesis